MVLKESIFDSTSEMDVSDQLSTVWGNKYYIDTHTPFYNVFEFGSLNVTKKEENYLKMTSIDFTICENHAPYKPLMCIEFDGISEGYNKGNKFIQKRKNPLRKLKMELKLRIAKEHNFPFYVISYDERNFLSEKLQLTVLDGIIGQTLAGNDFEKKVDELLDIPDIELMNECEYNEYIEDLIVQAEVQLDFEHDPIIQKTWEIREIVENEGINICPYQTRHFSIPELPTIGTVSFNEFKKAWEEIQWHCYEVFNERLNVKSTAMVRNFEGIHASPLVIVENIANLLFFYKLAKKYRLKIPKMAENK